MFLPKHWTDMVPSAGRLLIEMVKGAMKTLKTDCAVATSGIAGPGGGYTGKTGGYSLDSSCL